MHDLPKFEPAWWLNNPHLQTMWAELVKKCPEVELVTERFELQCGDFIDLDWSSGGDDIVVVLHGLGGSSESAYVRGMIHALVKSGFRTVALHFRGCSKEPNRGPDFFHGGQTCDLAEFIAALKQRAPHQRIFLVGFSMGANILLKYLGEMGEKVAINGAVAISVPFLIDKTQENLSNGFAQVYQQYLLIKLKIILAKKIIHNKKIDLNLFPWLMAKNIKQFDERITVPLHEFGDTEEYYLSASSRYYLKNIRSPILIIHAKDDPFVPLEAIPHPDELSSTTELLLTDHGGHVGFVAGPSPKTPIYWLEQVVPLYLKGLE